MQPILPRCSKLMGSAFWWDYFNIWMQNDYLVLNKCKILQIHSSKLTVWVWQLRNVKREPDSCSNIGSGWRVQFMMSFLLLSEELWNILIKLRCLTWHRTKIVLYRVSTISTVGFEMLKWNPIKLSVYACVVVKWSDQYIDQFILV